MENDANPHSALIQPIDQNVIQNIKLGYRKLLLTNIVNDPVHNENLEKTLKNPQQPLQGAAEADDSLARNEILTDDEIIRTLTAEDDDDDVNPVKISQSEAAAALNTSLQWAEEQNFEAHEIMLLRCLRDCAFELKIGMAAQKKNKSLTFLDTDYMLIHLHM
ncbi:hypothetical protein AVEN_202330-1 [Araneus ventricosus]|uniref:DDE-1 domain-containing protein n=1 Tax=Araneus ventricosus TaxID=182803 RepID=A0A4Y2E9B6_ARAVE|nr:hypothetical protein AVEN_202330-1 [Araneus ventricosus]